MKIAQSPISPCMLIALAGYLPAADITWDTSPTAGIQGGGENWNITDTNWTTNGGATRNAWSNVTNAEDTAVFSTTGGAVNVTVPIDLAGIRTSGNVGGYVLSGAGLNFGTAQGSINTTSLAVGNTFTINNVISGTGGLTIAAGGTVRFTGANTYTGSTIISSGTLSVNGAWGDGSSDVSIASSATLNLDVNANDTIAIGKLIVNGTPQPTGIYGALGSGAQFQRAYLTGSGNLIVSDGPASDFGTWKSENGIPNATATWDSDGDGISNAIEFVINSDPSSPDSGNLLPTVTVDATYLNFIYRRSWAAAAYSPYVEYSTDCKTWTFAEAGENGVILNEDSEVYRVGTDRVIMQIPRALASGGRLFARLRVEIP